jgi:hypothetical protein
LEILTHKIELMKKNRQTILPDAERFSSTAHGWRMGIRLFLGFMPAIVLFSGLLLSEGCKKDAEETAVVPLTEAEKTDLLVLREEEKLARDVYIYAFTEYGITVFNNISESEQRHMDKVLTLLNTYGIPDPASTAVGVFNNPSLQALYNTLTAKVDSSSMDALTVGATIEDLDIEDIEVFMGHTVKADILSVYENLQCGSRNHMRSFYAQILENGGSYTPQFISIEYFTEIINSGNEKCGN